MLGELIKLYLAMMLFTLAAAIWSIRAAVAVSLITLHLSWLVGKGIAIGCWRVGGWFADVARRERRRQKRRRAEH